MAEDKKWMLTIGQRREASPLPFPDKNPVKEIKEGMEVIQETKRVAEEIAGAGKLKEELDKTREELERQRQEEYKRELAEIREMLRKAVERDDTPAIKELQAKLEEVKDQYHREQLESLRQEIIKLQESRERGVDISQEIKRIKEVGQELGLTTGVPTVPADIQIQLKKMDIELQLQLAKMNEERDRRDKEWQLALKKWEEERALREQEIRQKYEVEKDRMDTLKSTFERGAKIIGRAITESEEGEKAGSIATAYHVEAAEGEMGEFACPKCSSPVAVAPDAARAICANCGFTTNVRRIKVEPQKQAT